MEITRTPYHDKIDRLEAALQELPVPQIEIRHFFSPGKYCREMTVRVPARAKGVVVTSKIHSTDHKFTLSVGALQVVTEDGSEKLIEAPYLGMTKKGTRRAAFFPVDSVWTTMHLIDWVVGDEGKDPQILNETIQKIEDEIIESYQNPLLEGEFKNKIQCLSLQPVG